MKKSIFFLAAGAYALTACTSEEVIDDVVLKQNAIGFETVANKMSRLDDVKDLVGGDLEFFNVYGYYTTPDVENSDGTTTPSLTAIPVFNNVKVKRTSTGAAWTYDGDARYWVPGGHYYFYAYNCGNAEKGLSEQYGKFVFDLEGEKANTERVLKIEDYVCNETHQHDLIYAYNVGQKIDGNSTPIITSFPGIVASETGNKSVKFQFNHILTKVKAQFASRFPEDYTVNVSDVTINGLYDKATYNPNNGWDFYTKTVTYPKVFLLKTNDAETDELEIKYQLDKDNNLVYTPTHSAFVLPKTYNNEEVAIKFDIEVVNKDKVVMHKTMVANFKPSWTQGCSYTYNITIDGSAANLEQISFELDETVSLFGWSEQDVENPSASPVN